MLQYPPLESPRPLFVGKVKQLGYLLSYKDAASDRLAIVGDVINTNDYLAGTLPILREPPRTFSVSPAQNRDSIRKLWSLRPRTICTGHGPPLRDMARFERFVLRLAHS